MNIGQFNLFEDNDFEFKSSYPLFNFDALRESQIEDLPLNLVSSQKVSEIVEEILYKKVKVDKNCETVVLNKKKGRKPIAKNGKQWDDPNITLQEIIENDLAGEPMESEIKMKEERLKNLKEKKAQKKIQREQGTTVEVRAIEESQNFVAPNFLNLRLDPLIENNPSIFTPRIVFRDGKIVVDNSNFTVPEEREKKLTIVDNKKPYKLTSMSFRTKNNTAKWTPEETKKFYKAIEIFGADFSMIAKLFPTRNRDQIKNKFNKEEKINLNRMNEAFKRNTTLSKRSLMDRIRNFSTALISGENALPVPGEFDIELGGIKALERQYSNTSTDSMDLKIIEEIQEIFTKEIRPTNALFTPLAIMNNVPTERHEVLALPVENFFSFGQEQTRKEEIVSKRENLLLRFMN